MHALLTNLQVELNILDLAILDNKSVTLASEVAKDLCGIKVKIQSFGELASRVGNESNLDVSIVNIRIST